MRPGEFWEALGAYNEDTMANRRHVGELIRGATLRLVNLQLRAGSQIRDPRDFWRMPWDEQVNELASLDSMTDEDREAEVDKFNKLFGHGKRISKEHDGQRQREHLGLLEEDEGRSGRP